MDSQTSQHSGGSSRKRKVCSHANKQRKILAINFSTACMQRSDGRLKSIETYIKECGAALDKDSPQLANVLQQLMEVDDDLVIYRTSLAKADAECDEKRKHDKIDLERKWESKFNEKVEEMKKYTDDKVDAVRTQIEKGLTKKFGAIEKELAEARTKLAMIGFRQVANELREYYACEVGGLIRQASTKLNSAELSNFLADVNPKKPGNQDLYKKLTQRLTLDGHEWTWRDLCEFIEFSNSYAHPKPSSNKDVLTTFLDTPELNIAQSQERLGITMRNVKNKARAFLQSYTHLFEED